MSCTNCAFFSNNPIDAGGTYCIKFKSIKALRDTYPTHTTIRSTGKDVLNNVGIYLNFEESKLDQKDCKKTAKSLEENKAAHHQYYKKLSNNTQRVLLAPIKIVRDICQQKPNNRFFLKSHCAWKHCPNQQCTTRKRGHRCPKQTKLTIMEAT